MTVATLDYAIDVVMELSLEEQEMLVEIIQRRQIEARRQEMAADAKRSLDVYHAGELKPQSATAVIRELHRGLE